MKIVIFGSQGLVGSAVVKFKNNNLFTKVISSNRKTLNLFDYESVKKFIEQEKPDYIVNAAAKVGGILANNTYRADFILENLKINVNLLESLIPFNNIKLINLGVVAYILLTQKTQLKRNL